MDLSGIFYQALAIPGALEAYGFQKKGEKWYLTKALSDSGLEARFVFGGGKEEVRVFDQVTGDEFAQFSSPSAHGEFVGNLREEVKAIVAEIKASCFKENNLRKVVEDYVKKELKAALVFPFSEDKVDCALERKKGDKWFGLLMEVPFAKLGLDFPGVASILNLKLPPEEITALIDGHYFLRCYHMNKKEWISVVLFADLDQRLLQKLIDESYRLVYSKK
jgi:predicted DNA-binding protein (MmcQ/YjbR family)